MPDTDRRASWRLRCERIAGLGAVEFTFADVRLSSPDDADEWARRTTAEFERLGGGAVYVLIGLDGLSVSAKASRRFGERRSDILGKYSKGSFRYGGDTFTKISINTSSVMYDTEGALYASRAAALDAMRRTVSA